MTNPQKHLGMTRKVYREALRKAEKERRPASYWLQKLAETDAEEPELWEFCAREFYGITREEANARAEQVVHEKIGDGLVNLAEFKKVFANAFGMTVAQAEAQNKLCRKMFAERPQDQA